MKILVACEESQAVTIELRRLGHEAYSCDIEPCSGGHPEWHIQGDVLQVLDGDCCFSTVDGTPHQIKGSWDMILAFPPCTFLTITGNRWFNVERYGEKAIQRQKGREDAIKFFMALAGANCPRIAIENPVGVMSSEWRKPDQIIQPFQFGHPQRKSTCLWLRGLPKLTPTKIVEPDVYYYVAKNGKTKSDSRWRSQCKKEERAKFRSKTFPGIAKAMAEQWAGDIK